MSANQSISGATDLFVIGGGPAGLATAIAARQRGLRVVVADGSRPPIDKACGEGFLPDGVLALERLGLQIPASDVYEFCGIRFLSQDCSADAHFSGRRNGISIRRTTLHRAMVERAEILGAELLWNRTVTGISHDGVQIGDHFVRARWIVGADGSNSRVRRWADLDRGPRPRLRYAFRRHYRITRWTDHMEVHWGEQCQGYATAVSDEQVCVALASHNPQMRLEAGLRTLPGLAKHLNGAEIVSSERGALTGNRQFTCICRGNVALIGDASGTVDAITGEGLGLAFCQAIALAQCLERGDLSSYQAEHRKLMRRPLWMARLLLTLDRRPRLQRRTLDAFRKHPEIFRRFVELHVGELPPLHIVKDGLTLGWGLLTA
jgi:menaquinone-9 beta-reductase